MHIKALPLLTLIVAIVLLPSFSLAELTVRVITVHEGDRLTIRHDGSNQTIYLKDIDCPDLKQPYGKQAKRATAAYIGGREVMVRSLKRDGQGRTTAEIFLPDGRNVAHELVKEGLAWLQRSKSRGDSLGQLEELARAERKGLWSDPNPVPPWKWKAAKKATRKYSN